MFLCNSGEEPSAKGSSSRLAAQETTGEERHLQAEEDQRALHQRGQETGACPLGRTLITCLSTRGHSYYMPVPLVGG